MASTNPFDLLGDDDNDDPTQLIAAAQLQKVAAKKPAAPAASPPVAAKLPSKPLPPAEAVKEARSNAGRGGASRGGFGRGGGRGGRGGEPRQNRASGNENMNPNGYSGGYGGGAGGAGGEEADGGRAAERERGPYSGPRQPFRGGRRGGYGNGEAGGDSERPPRRAYERRSGTGRGYEMKREGAGRGNWGTPTDETLAQETEEKFNIDDKIQSPEKNAEKDDTPSAEVTKDTKEGVTNEAEQKEEEDKEMTLEEYEKVREEKRKALLAMKSEERKVDVDKEFESMQQLSLKKANDEVFIKLGSDKDAKRKDERAKKSVSINEFLKPAEGGRYYTPGGRGRGRGRGGGDRGPYQGGSGPGGSSYPAAAPSIEDPGQFPTLGGK
ncbi:hypothetical protein J5N97_004822 [Dioscorea zingiberensis]|uniref:Hyaluronan/mRNA-binding protein domain-containing protein n=1 Tax=Dioscorea zingiberensis TaxID=325984 RepID=A0A9D5D6Z0_9LILI|nr:hypothetical protein J5N97_004822 [Dioscorea zingiberensis]